MSYHITSEVLIQYYSGLVTMLNDVRVIRSCRNLLHRQNNFGIAVLPDPFSKGLAGARLIEVGMAKSKLVASWLLFSVAGVLILTGKSFGGIDCMKLNSGTVLQP